MSQWASWVDPHFATSMFEQVKILENFDEPVSVYLQANGQYRLVNQFPRTNTITPQGERFIGMVAALPPSNLGDSSFLASHKVRFAYVVGEMAGGISSEQMVLQLARDGILGFFGCAGLPIHRVEQVILNIRRAVPDLSNYGFNLMHDPLNIQYEHQLVNLFLKYKVRRISVSGFLKVTPALVQFRAAGMCSGPDGVIHAKNHIFAKTSRTEVAQQFMEPAPTRMLQALLEQGKLSQQQADLAARVPLAEDITAEGDCGGYTDRMVSFILLDNFIKHRDQVMEKMRYRRRIRIGVAGGIGSPVAVSSAFSAGADYVLTGSINQASVESDTSITVKKLLCDVQTEDVDMAPAADMFEMGTKVQVVRHRNLFAARAKRLYELYRTYSSIEQLPSSERVQLEEQVFRCSFEEIWQRAQIFFQERNTTQLEKAMRNPRHKMALIFRWYLAMSCRWAQQGDQDRYVDYQIWCSPAMGAFNHWVQNSYMQELGARTVVQMASNLLYGGAYQLRVQMLRMQGVPLPTELQHFRPRKI